MTGYKIPYYIQWYTFSSWDPKPMVKKQHSGQSTCPWGAFRGAKTCLFQNLFLECILAEAGTENYLESLYGHLEKSNLSTSGAQCKHVWCREQGVSVIPGSSTENIYGEGC